LGWRDYIFLFFSFEIAFDQLLKTQKRRWGRGNTLVEEFIEHSLLMNGYVITCIVVSTVAQNSETLHFKQEL